MSRTPPPFPTGDDRESWSAWRRALEATSIRYSPLGRTQRRRWSLHDGMLWVAGVGLRAVGLHGRGRRNAIDVRLVELEFAFPDLPPAFDGFRILHVTDPHFDALPEAIERASVLTTGIEVDLCVLGGDYLLHHGGPHDHVVPQIEAFLAGVRPRHGTFAILGNHDPVALVPVLEELGVTVLVNESFSVEQAGQHIHLTGTDDVHYFHSEAAYRALDAAPGGFRIALIHSPELAGAAAERDFDLYLCGHTHGGQICLPGGRPILSRLAVHRDYASGLWQHDGMVGYTSTGLGVSGIPVRFNCRGEITLVTLRRAGQPAPPSQ